MKHKKKIIVGVLVFIFAIVFLYMNTYITSLGFVSKKDMEVFFENKPTCYGVSIPLNQKAAQADAPGYSLCVGYLKHNETSAIIPENELTQENLAVLQKRLDERNKTKDFPMYPNKHTPKIVGTYSGINVEEQYWCSDVCPDNGILFLNLTSSTKETCEDLNGHKLYKWGWGHQYIGCSPTENKYSD